MTHRRETKTVSTPSAPWSWYVGLAVLVLALLIGGAL